MKQEATVTIRRLINSLFYFQVENVSRYLYYVNPEKPSLQFVHNREKLRQYLLDLSEASMKKQTQQNYLKGLRRSAAVFFHCDVNSVDNKCKWFLREHT